MTRGGQSIRIWRRAAAILVVLLSTYLTFVGGCSFGIRQPTAIGARAGLAAVAPTITS